MPTGFFITNKERLFPEAANYPNDNYYYNYYDENSNTHSGLKDIAYKFAAG